METTWRGGEPGKGARRLEGNCYLLGNEAKGGDVLRPQRSEVAVVERREFGLTQALDNREDSGVDESDIVTVADVPNPEVVLGEQVLHPVGSGRHVVEEGEQHSGVQAKVDPVVDLHEHRRRDDARLLALFDQRSAGGMIGVATIERRVQRTRVEDQRHAFGVGRSSPARRAVSQCPDAPTPRLRGTGRSVTIFSWTASRIKAAIETRRSAETWRSFSRSSSGIEIVVRIMTSCYHS